MNTQASPGSASIPPPLDSAGMVEPLRPEFGELVPALLREPVRVARALAESPAPTLIRLLLLVFGGAILYGLVVGSFSGGPQWWQVPLKIACGVVFAAVICMPSLYVMSCLAGAKVRLPDVAGLIAGMLGLALLLLASFAPVAWVFSQSTESIGIMAFLHWVFVGVSWMFGWRFLQGAGERLQMASRAPLGVWMWIFILVMLQLTTTLRPLLGKSDAEFFQTEKRFFLEHWKRTMSDSRQ